MSERSDSNLPEGVVAIIQNGERYLMIRRPDDIRAGGYWCFVGGEIEKGETQEQALVREVGEEVGLEVEPVEKVWQCASLTKEWLLHFWTVNLLHDRVRANPREVAECRWLTVDEILELSKLIPSVPEFFRFRGLL